MCVCALKFINLVCTCRISLLLWLFPSSVRKLCLWAFRRNWRLRGFLLCFCSGCHVWPGYLLGYQPLSAISPPVNQNSTGCGLAFKCNRIIPNTAVDEMPKLFIPLVTSSDLYHTNWEFLFIPNGSSMALGTREIFFRILKNTSWMSK